MNYDIYLDESGLFLETSSQIREREEHESNDGRKFPSQIAGVVCCERVISTGNANSMLKAACAAGGIEHTARFHANEHSGSVGFPEFVESLCASMKSKEIQPVRLVNTEKVSFGDRVATYCNILAELLVRVCQQLEAEGDSEVGLNVFAARLVTKDDNTTGIEILDASEYLIRIRELFARVALANGFNSSHFRWRVNDFQIRSAREDKRLQLADVVSYISHDNFFPLRKHTEAMEVIRTALGSYNWSFSCDETLARVRDLQRRESFGSALIALAERATSVGVEKRSLQRYQKLARDVVSALSALPPVLQKPQLQIIAAWLNQVAEHRHDLDTSLRCCHWMQKILCKQDSSSDWPNDWLQLITDTWALTACNHDANTIAGRAFADRIEAVVPKLSGRWEYAGDLMFAFIVKAVHQNDCFEHQLAADRMAAVARYYESLDGFFADVFEGVFPKKVLSDLRARALGAQLQSRIALLLAGHGDAEHCRSLSEQAISEFSHEGDLLRQWQYRCELETVVADYKSARQYLAKSLGSADSSHEAISDWIRLMPDDIGKAFALLHWTRIGAMSAAGANRREADSFLAAWLRSKLQYSSWCVGETAIYPAHGIFRNIAVAMAGSGDSKATSEAIGRLRGLVLKNPRPVFEMILVAAHLQAAGLLHKSDRRTAKLLIEGDRKSKGVAKMMERLRTRVAQQQPAVNEILSSWHNELKRQDESGLDSRKLIEMGRVVGY